MKIKDRVTNCTKMISKQNFVSYNQGVWNREGKEKSSWNDDLSKKYNIDHFWLQQNDKKIYSLIISKM